MTDRPEGQRGGVLLYLAIAFGVSWGLAFAVRNAGGTFGTLHYVAYMAGPSIAALVCVLIYDRDRFWRALGFERNPFNLWLGAAFLLPILITVISFAATLVLSDRTMPPVGDSFARALTDAGVDLDSLPMSVEQLAIIQIASAPFIAAIANTIAMILTEELGWRGFLWDRLERLGFWRNAILTGVIWGLWHAPIIALFGHNYPHMPVLGPILFIGWTVLLTPMISLVRARGGSIVHAAMFHGVINGVAPLSIILLSDASMPWRGAVGAGGFIALALFWPLVFVLAPRKAEA